ncbi:hypothetical protein FHX48_000557 [Microbacterium halimionae]|uniref:Uncharacterized protein n=1 Tax=Microbacterium halimionae TaxID=1526413 RepID=A0A7W3PKH2_9MICO|nr:hypothetical protein [Microbacterium halimionae]MBA8815505.1 hypothetical protein [Microbacterium halimionae]NII95552.1 hypothetical protein [Microbacterium halimionae]
MPELIASVLMALAMLDAAFTHRLAPVYWTALLIAGAIGIAALRTSRRARKQPRVEMLSFAGSGIHTTLGMIVMAALMLGMSHGAAAATTTALTSAAVHHHGLGAGSMTVALVGGAAVYSAVSFVLAARQRGWLVRAEYATMGATTSLMAVALII